MEYTVFVTHSFNLLVMKPPPWTRAGLSPGSTMNQAGPLPLKSSLSPLKKLGGNML